MYSETTEYPRTYAPRFLKNKYYDGVNVKNYRRQPRNANGIEESSCRAYSSNFLSRLRGDDLYSER